MFCISGVRNVTIEMHSSVSFKKLALDGEKARYFAESIWKISLKVPFLTENAILENTK